MAKRLPQGKNIERYVGIGNMLNELIKLSPCPVYFVPHDTAGSFCYTSMKQWIKIKENTPTEVQIATLAHEIGHAICYNKRCGCYSPKKKTLCEYHAFIYSLSLLYIIGNIHILRLCMKNMVQSYYKNSEGWYKYHLAIKHIMKTKLWKRCIKLAYGQKQLLLFS